MRANLSSNRDPREPLASRAGMVGEVLKSAKHYPLIFVVVEDPLEIQYLQSLFVQQAQAVIDQNKVLLPRCEIQFGTHSEAEVFRGTIPVFCDPAIYYSRRAA